MRTTARSVSREVAAVTVPSLVLPIIRPHWTVSELEEAGRQAGRALGRKVELDVALLDRVEEGLGQQAYDYWRECRRFWDRISAGEGAEGILVKRDLTTHRQVDSASERADLGDVLASLMTTEMRPWVEEATSSDPDWLEVDALIGSPGSRCTSGNGTSVTAVVSGRQPWSDLLGGQHSRGELSRVFNVEISHAPWRDRRSRRLVSVRVSAVELWPDPAQLAAGV